MSLHKIKQSLGKKGFQLVENGQFIYCPHVNGLTTYCLHGAGFTELAEEGMQRYKYSDAFNAQTNMFYKVVTDEGVVDKTYNACKNVIAALGLAQTGSNAHAKKVLSGVQNSPLMREDGLLNREFLDDEVNENVYPQTQLWYALALFEVGQVEDAGSILEKVNGLIDQSGFLPSFDCRLGNNDNSRYYLDDQALHIWAMHSLDNPYAAQNEVVKTLLHFTDEKTNLSKSYLSLGEDSNVISTYKNALFAIALAKDGEKKKVKKICTALEQNLASVDGDFLMESTETYRFAPDNNALYLYAKALAESHEL